MTSNGGFTVDADFADPSSPTSFEAIELDKTSDRRAHSLCVLGTGDFGRAIAQHAVASGFTVAIGTRNKHKQPEMLQLLEATGAKLMSQTEAVAAAPLVVVAVARHYYETLPLRALSNRVIIDVSNSTPRAQTKSFLSNAEHLQQLVPSASVVKAFNVISAYLLETGGIQGSKEIPFATDSGAARQQTAQLVRDLGFVPVDMGPLRAARDIEKLPLEFFRDWRGAFTVVATLFFVGYLLCFFKFQLCRNITQNEKWDWSVFKHILMINFNRNLGIVALITLGAVYLPGVIAGFIQLYRGTKYSRFPRWLDRWLRMRKQLGLFMLAMAGTHGCISLGIYHPDHQQTWLFEPPKKIRTEVRVNDTHFEQATVNIWSHDPSWRGEIFLALGAVSLCLLVVLGITSLPSVTASLSWREFTFVQSKLGWTALLAASLHDAVLGWDYMIFAYKCYMPTGLQIALYLPVLCVLGKLVQLIPPLRWHLKRIRSGRTSRLSQA